MFMPNILGDNIGMCTTIYGRPCLISNCTCIYTGVVLVWFEYVESRSR